MDPVRKPTRLREYDYSSPGAYFITICTRDRRCILSDIPAPPDLTDASGRAVPRGQNVGEGLAPPAVILSPMGVLVETQLLLLPDRFPSLSMDRYVIMPNHVHLLLSLSGDVPGGASPSPTIPDMVGALKSQTSRLSGAAPLWQRSFYDHVVRNDTEYGRRTGHIPPNGNKE